MLAAAANVVGAWFAAVFAYWNGHYFVPGAAFALGLGIVLLIPLVDHCAGAHRGARHDRLRPQAAAADRLAAAALPEAATPKVSIHIPAYNEPPEMLKQTLDAVARLDYPNFECVVVINNTPDPALWQPIEEHCRALGERFKFVNADDLAGFKAGALRLALAHTAADAEVIGVHRRRLRRAAGLAQGSGAAVRAIRPSAWCRRRRITATANAASCITP